MAAGFFDNLRARLSAAVVAAPDDCPPDLIAARDALDEHALIDIFLRVVMPARADRDTLVSTIMVRFGSFAGFIGASSREIATIGGLGEHSLAAARLFHETGLRLARSQVQQRDVMTGRQEVIAYLFAVLSREPIEQFRILFLDDGHMLIVDEAQARGTVNHTPVYPREVARRALELGARSLILVHNHPSGDPTPSDADLVMTGQIVAACGVVEILVKDHIIIGNGKWVSLNDLGLMGTISQVP